MSREDISFMQLKCFQLSMIYIHRIWIARKSLFIHLFLTFYSGTLNLNRMIYSFKRDLTLYDDIDVVDDDTEFMISLDKNKFF